MRTRSKASVETRENKQQIGINFIVKVKWMSFDVIGVLEE